MDKALTTRESNAIATNGNAAAALAGQLANHTAALDAFADYRNRKADNTIIRQDGDLRLFAQFLDLANKEAVKLAGGDLATCETGNLSTAPQAWENVTWGLVQRFVDWQLAEGYSTGSVNVRLSTVKVYATLASQAGALDAQELALIRTVKGYRQTEAKRINEKRETTRRTYAGGQVHKKAEAVAVTLAQAEALKAQPQDTPRGRRDGLLVCLLVEHGLRVSEVAALQVTAFDLEAGTMTFYRPKTDKTEIHKLAARTLEAAKLYFEQDALAVGPLLRSSKSRSKAGELNGAGMSIRAIRQRVRVLGERAGIEGLSPHDLRHYAATRYAGLNYGVKRLMEIFGWTSPAMAIRYVKDNAVVEVE